MNESNTPSRLLKTSLMAAACTLALGLGACEREGPLERAGEEVDEAVDTIKNGEESTQNRIDDAFDELRE